MPVSIFQRSNNQDVGPWELADLEQESHTESFFANSRVLNTEVH